jgi:hypothetical protein
VIHLPSHPDQLLEVLEYWKEAALCLLPGCNTSFCPACDSAGRSASHEHKDDVRKVTLYQMAAFATLGLQFSQWPKVASATIRFVVVCSACGEGK